MSPAALGGSLGAALLFLLAACGPDLGQVALCERVLWTVVAVKSPGRITASERDPDRTHSVALTYEATAPDGRPIAGKIACRFAAGGFDRDRLVLTGLWTDDAGELSVLATRHVKQQLGLR